MVQLGETPGQQAGQARPDVGSDRTEIGNADDQENNRAEADTTGEEDPNDDEDIL